MDMSKYGGNAFIGLDDVRDGPRRGVIEEVSISDKFDKPVLHFSDGTKLSVNKTNSRMLIKSFGADSEAWVGHEIKMFLGRVEFSGQPRESVLIAPLQSRGSDDMDDSIPF
jgi:hypothetical protein